MNSTAVNLAKLKFSGVARSELLKFRSLRSNIWLIISAVAVIIGIGLIYGSAVINSFTEMVANTPPEYRDNIPDIDAMVYGIGGVGMGLANLLIGSIAVLYISREYANGLIAATFINVPRRSAVYWAKFINITLFSFIVGAASAAVTYLLATTLVIDSEVLEPLRFNPGVVMNWFGVGAAAVFVSWIGLGFGALFRSNAGGVIALVAAMFLLQIIVAIFAQFVDLVADVGKYIPSNLADVIVTYGVSSDADINYTIAVTVLGLTAFAVTLLGYLRFKLQDPKS